MKHIGSLGLEAVKQLATRTERGREQRAYKGGFFTRQRTQGVPARGKVTAVNRAHCLWRRAMRAVKHPAAVASPRPRIRRRIRILFTPAIGTPFHRAGRWSGGKQISLEF